MTANNVLQFPNIGAMPKPKNEEELGERFLKNKKTYVDHVVDHYGTQLINKLGMHGLDVWEENFVLRFSFCVESLRATLYGTLDIDHPFHEIIEDSLELLDIDIEEFDDEDL